MKDYFIKILSNISKIQSRLTSCEVENRKKYMAIQEAMMSIKKTLESLIRNLEEEKNEWET